MSKTLEQLFVGDTPLLDVRAEVEYQKGSFPSATNIPILNDQERHDVGISYKDDGPEQAELLGHQLVSGQERQSRIERWVHFVSQSSSAHLYCFRGGKRSQIACDWLRQAGHPVPRISGGYKAMRTFLLDQFTALPPFVIISGHTGVGKTDLLGDLDGSIDLEGLANHRGSAFGKRLGGQPSQIDFENALAIGLLKNRAAQHGTTVLEDEGRLIGRIQIPTAMKQAMDTAPVVVLEEPQEDRVTRILRDYIVAQHDELQALHGAEATELLATQLLTAVDAIKKRLGGVAHKELSARVRDALQQHRLGDITGHRIWISTVLETYYDPMYRYQLEQKSERIVFRGDRQAVIDWYRSESDRMQVTSRVPHPP